MDTAAELMFPVILLVAAITVGTVNVMAGLAILLVGVAAFLALRRVGHDHIPHGTWREDRKRKLDQQDRDVIEHILGGQRDED